MFWTPDFCPSGSCRIEVAQDFTLIGIVRCCPHHQALRDSGLTDQQVFRAVLQSSRLKERARWEVKLVLGLDKEHPGVPYRVNQDGSFTVLTDRASLAWIAPDRSVGALPTITTQDRIKARTDAINAIASLERPPGVSAVTVD